MATTSTWNMLKETYNEWSEDDATVHAAAVAYYAIFSIAPLLLIAIAIAGFVYGREAAETTVMSQAQGVVGKEGAAALQQMLQHAQKPGANILTAAIGIITLLIGAGGVFSRLQGALNTIWEVEPKPNAGWWAFIRQRLLTYVMLLVIGFLLLLMVVMSATLSGLSSYIAQYIPGGREWIPYLVNFLVQWVIATLLFAMIFKVLPDANVAWKNVWLGSAITGLLFVIGNILIGLYLGKSAVGSTYGAAGSLVLILVWIYYSAQILFFGAEFTQVWSRRHGPPIEPDELAKPKQG